MSLAMKERIGTWGDDQPAYYIASTGVERPQFQQRVPSEYLGPNGIEKASFSTGTASANFSIIRQTDYSSYAGQVIL